MGQSLAIPRVIPNDWKRLDLIVNKIKFNLGHDSSPTFVSMALTGLTDGSIIFVDNNGVLSENNTNLNWNDVNGILTVRDTIQVKDSSGNIVMFSDDTQFYITSSVAIPIEAGMVMGLWLFWGTYASP